jgi:hypothetical protein
LETKPQKICIMGDEPDAPAAFHRTSFQPRYGNSMYYGPLIVCRTYDPRPGIALKH